MTKLLSPPERSAEKSAPTAAASHSYDVRRVSEDVEAESLYKNFHAPLSEVENKVSSLLTWPEGWNGYDVAAPRPDAVRHARSWIAQMYGDVRAMGGEWHNPHVAADEDGDVMFEWWNDGKGLTFYVSEESATYLIAWGTSMVSQMEDGEAATSETRQRLWAWLLS